MYFKVVMDHCFKTINAFIEEPVLFPNPKKKKKKKSGSS